MEILPLTDEGSAVLERSALVDWYRVDISRRVRRAFALGGALLLFGMCFSAVWFLPDVPLAIRATSGSAGVALIVAGALLVVTRLSRLLREDHYVAAHLEALVVHVPGLEEVVSWDAIARVYGGEGGALVLELRDGREIALAFEFADIDGVSLARRLEDYRRKASFHLLRV